MNYMRSRGPWKSAILAAFDSTAWEKEMAGSGLNLFPLLTLSLSTSKL